MSRPLRTASTKLKTYAEKSDDESDNESFDEEDDPDQIEIPGGGKTLEAAVKVKHETKPELSSLLLGGSNNSMLNNHHNFNNSLISGGGGVPGTTFIKQEPQPSSSSSSSMFKNNNNNNNNALINNPLQQFLNSLSALQSNPNTDMFSSPLFSAPQNFPNTATSPVNSFDTLFGMNSPFIRSVSDPSAFFSDYTKILQQGSRNMGPDFLSNSLASFPNSGQNPVNIGQLWGNAKTEPTTNADAVNAEEEEDHQQDEMAVVETYSDYKPAKLQMGKRHPDPVVETASLSSVLPPDVTYKLHLPSNIIDRGLLSALQLEAVVYACQQHEYHLPSKERAGFLVGDGAGVGKGRTIAGIIYENWLCGRKKSIWVSVSSDLKYDSERDLSDIGADLTVTPLNKLKYGKIDSKVHKGVIFSTYSSLIGESSQGGKYNTRLKQLLQWCGSDFDGVIVFDECHRAKNLCPVGATKPTKTGLTVQELQKRLPNARVVYASATGASEPRNMAYMVRLGIWGEKTPFKEFSDFIQAVERRGVGAMEIVAMDMKLRGAYIARQLSFQGVTFNIEEAPLTPQFVKMYDDSVQLWVDLMHRLIEAIELMQCDPPVRKAVWAQFWSSHQRFFKYLCIASKVNRVVNIASEAVKLGKCVVIGLQSTGEARTLDQIERDEGELTDFVSTAKGVLQSLVEKHFPAKKQHSIAKGLTGPSFWESLYPEEKSGAGPSNSSSSSNKRKPTRKAAQKIKRHKYDSDDDDDEDRKYHDSDFELSGNDGNSSESDGSESSNASKTISSDLDSEEDEEEDYGVKKRGRPKKKSATKKKSTSSSTASSTNKPSPEVIAKVQEMKDEILKRIEELGETLPPNALDQLIDELGGPDDVAEMTGRKGRVIQSEDGQIKYETRSEVDLTLETINITEKQRFMDGEKKIAIISEAASSGISLQSDRRAKNTLRRVHITLELPWSADRAIQQFGRTHRSNQVNAPEYVFMISDLAGENRFASVVAKRLESLGALTHGDRRATETRDLSRFHIDTKYGREALEKVMKSIMKYEAPLVKPETEYPSTEHFFQEVRGALMGVGLIVNNEENRGTLTLEKDYANMSKFLNRILGMPVKLQNALFQYFMDTLNHVVLNAKKNGRFDLGILDLGDSGSGGMKKLSMVTYFMRHATGLARIELHRLLVERGLSWDDAMEKYSEFIEDEEGFYLSHQKRNMKRTAVLVCQVEDIKRETGRKSEKKQEKKVYAIYRPSTGLQLKRETLKDIESKYEKLEPELVKSHWESQFIASKTTCVHAYWRGNCKAKTAGVDCDIGLRERNYYVLSGAVLMVWSTVESVLARRPHSAKIQVVRVRDETLKIVGLLIPNHCATELMKELKTQAEITEEKSF